MRVCLLYAGSAVLCALVLIFAASFFRSDSRPDFPRQTIVLEKADGNRISFNVELARTPEQTAFGLMFKKSLPRDEGMLFVFEESRPVSFWMKNTPLALDLIFIREDGIITQISQGMPFDRAYIRSGVPVSYVLEINAGESRRQGLAVGDRLDVRTVNRE